MSDFASKTSMSEQYDEIKTFTKQVEAIKFNPKEPNLKDLEAFKVKIIEGLYQAARFTEKINRAMKQE